jgi:hypothetical protein
MSQSSYDQEARAFAGMIADLAPHDNRSMVNEEATAIPFGIAVAQGTADNQMLLPTSAGDVIEGITVHSHAGDNRGLSVDQDIPTKRAASVMRFGYVYCVPELAVTKDDPVYVRIADGVADVTETQKGSLTNIPDSGTCVLLHGARWAETGAKDTPTPVELKGALGKTSVQTFMADHAQATADVTQFLAEISADRAFLVEEVVYYNATGLAEDAANFFNIKVQVGATVVANWSTETGQEGTIAADTPVRLTNGAAANLILAPDSRLDLVLDETGTATLPAGTIQVTGRYL